MFHKVYFVIATQVEDWLAINCDQWIIFHVIYFIENIPGNWIIVFISLDGSYGMEVSKNI